MNTLNYRGITVDIDFDYSTKKHRIIFNKGGNKYIFDCYGFSAESRNATFLLNSEFSIEDIDGNVVQRPSVVNFGVSKTEFDKLYELDQTRETSTVPYNISSFKRVVNGVLQALTNSYQSPVIPSFFTEFPTDKINCFKITDGSFYQPITFDVANTADNEITVTVVDVEGIPEFSIDDGVTWQDSNVFSGIEAGDYVLKARSKTNLITNSKPITVEEPVTM
jgi:hypothetical protein